MKRMKVGQALRRKTYFWCNNGIFHNPRWSSRENNFVEATSTTGTTFKSESRTIHTLELEITAPTFETTSNFVAPGETVKVTGAKVTDKGGAKLQSSQITYSYQWFYKVGESFTIINGATGGTYKILRML